MAKTNRCPKRWRYGRPFLGSGILLLCGCVVALVFLLFPCSAAVAASCPSDRHEEEITCPDSDNPNKLIFLFAHGLGNVLGTTGNPGEWQYFANRVKAQGFGVWRTQVDRMGHISERGDQLAAFIGRANAKCKPAPKSVIAVGHSMGGLDLRYIVGRSQEAAGEPYTTATNLIRSVYTIATPHLGDPNACTAPGGAHDLCGHVKNDSVEHSPMQEFNLAYPSSDFAKLNIKFVAIYYECPDKEEGEDGVVLLDSQKWLGAWSSPEEAASHMHDGGRGYHKTGDCGVQYGCTPELCQGEEIDWIVAQEGKKPSFGQGKIQFYKNNKCDGDVIGEIELNYSRLYWAPRYNADPNDPCDMLPSCQLPFQNDEARSMRLIQAKKGTTINIYNSPDCGTGDDYSLITIKKDTEGCIDSFETKLDNDNVSLAFNKKGIAVNHLDGKVSCVDVGVPRPY